MVGEKIELEGSAPMLSFIAPRSVCKWMGALIKGLMSKSSFGDAAYFHDGSDEDKRHATISVDLLWKC
jgi:hypothetical protein